MRLALAFVICGVSPIMAEGVVIENCVLSGEGRMFAACDVSNQTNTAISSIRYAVTVTTPNRSVPWVNTYTGSPDRTFFSSIPGGIEPNETVEVYYQLGQIPSRASDFDLVAEIIPLAFKDVSGVVVELD